MATLYYSFDVVTGFPHDCATHLLAVRLGFATPEDINDHALTAPSKRIANAIPRYRKVLHGPILADALGLETIRAECARFNTWMTRLESLGAE